MRVNILAVVTVASLNASSSLAFAPNANAPNGVDRIFVTPLSSSSSSSNSLIRTALASSNTDASCKSTDVSKLILTQARNSFMSLLASSLIFLSPSPAMMDAAHAAVSTPSTQAVAGVVATTSTSSSTSSSTAKPKPIQSAKPVDPLASEKANIEAAKEKYNAAAASLSNAKKAVADAKTLFSKAETAVSVAENKVASSKKALIAANDKLADAKAKEGANGGNLAALSEVEKLASKVGK